MSSPSSFNLGRAFSDKLKESGIDLATAKKYGIVPVPEGDCPKALPIKEAGILLPYYDIKGKKTKFFRYRYLKQPKLTGFKALALMKKPMRYSQPGNTINELYLPPVIDWQAVASDPIVPILITEGEFKSWCGCLHTQYPCIGLGGVWCWKASKKGIQMLEGFEQFQWDQRQVYIVYDSDSVTNPMVMQAENALAKALTSLGAEPHIVRIPMSEDKKMGLDDFIMAKGTEKLDDLLEAAEVWQSAKELHRLNEEVVYVRDPGLILRLDNLQRMSPRSFIDHAFSTRTWVEEVATKNAIRRDKKSAPKEWISWPSRAEVPRITYAPGEDRITVKREFNFWPGWGVEPVEGDVTPWKELLDFLFRGDIKARTWFERWVAYPLQNPGTKMYSTVVMWGVRHGTGKSLVGYTIGKIYGRNFTEISDEHLRATHNEWAENKQFVMGDEITGGDKRGTSDRMKSIITRQLLRLNPKYIPSYTVPDMLNYYFTSNHPDSFFLEDDDRRHFIWEVTGPPMGDEFYKRYEKWCGAGLEVGKGISHLFHHLLTLDLGDFSPTVRTMMTSAKMNMISVGKSDVGMWVSNLMDSPDAVLRIGDRVIPFDLWRAEDLLVLYDEQGKTRVTANGISRELARQDAFQVASGAGVRTASHGQVRLWALRNPEAYFKLSGAECGIAYDRERNYTTKGRKPKALKMIEQPVKQANKPSRPKVIR